MGEELGYSGGEQSRLAAPMHRKKPVKVVEESG